MDDPARRAPRYVRRSGLIENSSVPASSVIPELAYADVAEAADWLCDAFGFKLRLRIGNHRAQLVFGNGAVIVTELGASETDSRGTHSFSCASKTPTAITHRPRSAARGLCIHRPTIHTGNGSTAPKISAATGGRSPNRSPTSIPPPGERRRSTSRWLMPCPGAPGDGSDQAGRSHHPQARPVAWSRGRRASGAAPEPPARRAQVWHQPSGVRRGSSGFRGRAGSR